jgi:integrase
MGVKVRQRPQGSGIWWIFIDHQGIRKAKKIGKDKGFAKEVAKKIEAKLTLGDMNLLTNDRKSPTFGDYAKTWIAVTVPATCKASTERDYKYILANHVLPEFGKVLVTKINRLMVKQFLMKKVNDGYSSSTVTHIKNVIGGVFNLAVDDEVIPANPSHRLGKVMRTRRLGAAIDPLTRDELSILLKSFKTHFPRHYPLALTLARTGMRLGETLALQWGDIDFRGRLITVKRGFSRGKVETPKNDKIRRVDMSKQLKETLRNVRHERKVETLQKGWGEMPEWVFVTERGKPVIANHWRKKIFDKALEKADLRKIRIHDLRHTYASLLIQGGESLPYVRDQLGHHSIKVTVDIYGHLAPEGNKQAVDKLDDATIRNLSATKKTRD